MTSTSSPKRTSRRCLAPPRRASSALWSSRPRRRGRPKKRPGRLPLDPSPCASICRGTATCRYQPILTPSFYAFACVRQGTAEGLQVAANGGVRVQRCVRFNLPWDSYLQVAMPSCSRCNAQKLRSVTNLGVLELISCAPHVPADSYYPVNITRTRSHAFTMDWRAAGLPRSTRRPAST